MSPYLRQPSIPNAPAFFRGDTVIAFFGEATIRRIYWHTLRGTWEKQHWRAEIRYSSDGPIFDHDMGQLKPVPVVEVVA